MTFLAQVARVPLYLLAAMTVIDVAFINLPNPFFAAVFAAFLTLAGPVMWRELVALSQQHTLNERPLL